ncbi:mechanosensitive ion channel family protein [Seongchinamella sediminis]|uniref:Mechanosensitive ion channel family protein n=1 Tax=Seongchinamella sediminis TaxID=2283635 RepID=A0A3L7E3K7_9GAMM|nr:mechanosensitive ion channel family protein [Seongchinamella sediminis]RLQ23505.1 mechanosensitive ion channel family protein [Seongchinamella sediminis]
MRTLSRLLLSLTLLVPLAWGQDEETVDVSARELIETAQKAEELVKEKASSDPNALAGQSTPLATMLGLRDAMRRKDYETAGEHLDRRYIDDAVGQYSDEALIRALAYVWNRQNINDITSISDDPQGRLDDGLPNYRDQIGSVRLQAEEIPIYLQRVPDGKGGRVWKLSNATVAKIPAMWEELGYNDSIVKIAKWLPEFYFLGMENWQVVGVIVFFLIAWPMAMLASYLLMRIALLIPNRFPLGIQRFFHGPMKFFLYIMFARALINELGLSLTARILLDSSGVDYIAFTVLALGLLSLLRDYQIRKMQYAGNTHYVALLKPFTTIVKVLMVTVIALFWAKQAGYDMSTILAGLGVGSLAVALAAQKTLENVIGAITLYTARPVSAGDFCRFGNVTGVVEEIGLRSTTIRTLDRSVLVIPNSMFSSVEIENFSQRDRIRFFKRYQMEVPGSAQMQQVLAEVREMLQQQNKVMDETISVRFETIVDANAILRLDAGVDTLDFQEYLAVAEALNLGLLDIAERAGVRFTGPARLNLDAPREPASAVS